MLVGSDWLRSDVPIQKKWCIGQFCAVIPGTVGQKSLLPPKRFELFCFTFMRLGGLCIDIAAPNETSIIK